MPELRFKPAPGTVGKPLTMEDVTNRPTPRLSYAEALARVAELEATLLKFTAAGIWNSIDLSLHAEAYAEAIRHLGFK